MSKRRKEDYYFLAVLKSGGLKLEDVPCKLYLPKTLTSPITLSFRPRPEQIRQAQKILPFFSIEGETSNQQGSLTRISADEIISSKLTTNSWGTELAESEFFGSPKNLVITQYFGSNLASIGENTSAEENTIGCFWITPNNYLSPIKTVEHRYDGNVKVETIKAFSFALENGLQINFDDLYSYRDIKGEAVLSNRELVGNFELIGDVDSSDKIQSLVKPLDDFLLLTSFASRHRCICLGWHYSDSASFTRYYRRELMIPDKSRSGFEELIEESDFPDFIAQAYKSLINTQRRELLRHAIYSVIPQKRINVESSFLKMYSAVETLVLDFRRENDFEKVLPTNQWRCLQRDLKHWLTEYKLLKDHPDKIEFITNKIGELNRISFSTAFNRFCEHYKLDLSKLWPVVNRGDGMSLSNIRNKIIHGEVFSRQQGLAVSTASIHLQWILERMLLSVLGWPITKSYASDKILSMSYPHEIWRERIKLLSTPAQNDIE